MDYLNEAFIALRAGDAYVRIVGMLLERAFRCGRHFRLQFDRQRLLKYVGAEEFARVLPMDPAETKSKTKTPLDIYLGELTPERAEVLERWLVSGATNEIETVSVLAADGHLLLRANDSISFVLFDLPETERASFFAELKRMDVPAASVSQIDVDVSRLVP
jgi:hypothetical protein